MTTENSLFYSFKHSPCTELTAFSNAGLSIEVNDRANVQNASMTYESSGFLTEMLLLQTLGNLWRHFWLSQKGKGMLPSASG